MSGLFVTATGTGMGKTYLTCLLLRHLAKVQAIKPVLSGLAVETDAESDAGLILAARGEAVTAAGMDRVAPFRFGAPLSPAMAAAAEGRALDYPALLGFCRMRLAEPAPLLIEGVGGAMVPLTDRYTVLDWMEALGLPVVVVGGNYLGGISHALTALACIRARGLRVAAMVLNESADGVELEATGRSIEAHGGVEVMALRRGAREDHAPLAALISSRAGFP